MSQNDFSEAITVDIRITVSGSGEFNPLGTEYPMDWTLSGTAKGATFTDTRTIKEKTCGTPYYSTKEYAEFAMPGSTGNTSGYVQLGQFERVLLSNTVAGPYLGEWKVNTDPVLSAFGQVNGENAQHGYYVVAKPEDQKIDDPILLDPAIDGIKRVYPGDILYTQGEVVKFWYVGPKERFPSTDRTFTWTPNTNPVLSSGGKADGELAKPGTIMLPESDFYIAKQSDSFDGMSYFYQNQGVIFDGQKWAKNLQDPTIYQPKDGPREFRNLTVGYFNPDIYPKLLEAVHSSKPFVNTTQLIDDTDLFNFSGTPKGSNEPINLKLAFRWGDYENAKIQPTDLLYDFGDAWSKYHAENLDWRIARKMVGSLVTLFVVDPPPVEPGLNDRIVLSTIFKDGEVTEIESQYVDPYTEQVYKNNFTVTVQANVSQK